MERELMDLGQEAIRQFAHRSLLVGWICAVFAIASPIVAWRCFVWAGRWEDEENRMCARVALATIGTALTAALVSVAVRAFLSATHPVASLLTSIGS